MKMWLKVSKMNRAQPGSNQKCIYLLNEKSSDSGNTYVALGYFCHWVLEFHVGLGREIDLASILQLNTWKSILTHSLFQNVKWKIFS